MRRPILRRAPVVLLVLAAAVLTSAWRVWVSAGTADPKAELEVESEYRNVWRRGSDALGKANEAFNSGVCDVGGNKRGCFEASAGAIAAIDAWLSRLVRVAVPERYRDGDAAFRAALNAMRSGLERRNQGLVAPGNNEDFVAGNDMTKEADAAMRAAYEKFPEDARP